MKKENCPHKDKTGWDDPCARCIQATYCKSLGFGMDYDESMRIPLRKQNPYDPTNQDHIKKQVQKELNEWISNDKRRRLLTVALKELQEDPKDTYRILNFIRVSHWVVQKGLSWDLVIETLDDTCDKEKWMRLYKELFDKFD
jgi:hypothetical protein